VKLENITIELNSFLTNKLLRRFIKHPRKKRNLNFCWIQTP